MAAISPTPLLGGPLLRASPGVNGRRSSHGGATSAAAPRAQPSPALRAAAAAAAALAALPLVVLLARALFAVRVIATAGAAVRATSSILDEPWFRSERPDLLDPLAAASWPIPKIIHLILPPSSTPAAGPPPGAAERRAAAAAAAAGCRRLHPDWAFRHWGEREARALVSERYPWALDTFTSYELPSQRQAAARLFVLHAHGGVVLSAGVGCQHRLDALRQFNAALIPLTPQTAAAGGWTGEMVSGAALAAPPRHPFVLAALEDLPRHNHRYGGPGLTSLMSSGDVFLARQLAKWVGDAAAGTAGEAEGGGSAGGKQAQVCTIPPSLFQSNCPGRALFSHGPGSGTPEAAGGCVRGACSGARAGPGAAALGAAAAPEPRLGGDWLHWDAALGLWLAANAGWAAALMLVSFAAGVGAAQCGPALSGLWPAQGQRRDRTD